MRIAIIGAGAMGSIYGGHLSINNDVYLIDKNEKIVQTVNENGLKIQENGQDVIYRPKAVVDTTDLPEMDLIILFVKALFSAAALEENKHLLGPDTYLMTLQNGSGHEDLLSQFVSSDRVIIGTTEDNGAILDFGYVRRGGQGRTNIGMVEGQNDVIMKTLKGNFDSCGFETVIHENIQQLIWDKLFVNTSLSAITGLLRCRIGYVYENNNAWDMAVQLLREAVAVARGLGLETDEEEVKKKMIKIAVDSRDGVTSICSDLRNKRRTEVDTISGSVIRAAEKLDIDVPVHKFIVNAIHALEVREEA